MDIGNSHTVSLWMQNRCEDTLTMDKCHRILFFIDTLSGSKLSFERYGGRVVFEA